MHTDYKFRSCLVKYLIQFNDLYGFFPSFDVVSVPFKLLLTFFCCFKGVKRNNWNKHLHLDMSSFIFLKFIWKSLTFLHVIFSVLSIHISSCITFILQIHKYLYKYHQLYVFIRFYDICFISIPNDSHLTLTTCSLNLIILIALV